MLDKTLEVVTACGIAGVLVGVLIPLNVKSRIEPPPSMPGMSPADVVLESDEDVRLEVVTTLNVLEREEVDVMLDTAPLVDADIEVNEFDGDTFD